MTTIKLKVKDSLVGKLLLLLGQFNPDDLEIIGTQNSYEANKLHLEMELNEIESGNSRSISPEKIDEILDKALEEYDH